MKSVVDRYDSGLKFRRTESAPAKQGGLWYTEDSQSTFTDGQGNKYWFIDTSGGNVTVNLPDAGDVTADTIFTVKRKTGGANTLTVQSASGNIDGAATHSIPTQYASYSYVSDGVDYWII
jgi:hypothetical protein